MVIATIHDALFYEDRGVCYCNVIDYRLVLDFLEYFDSVYIVGRKGKKKPEYVKIDSRNVTVFLVDGITSPKNFFLNSFKTYIKIKEVVRLSDVVYCRGTNGIIAQYIAKKNNITDLVYLGGCVYDSLINYGTFYKRIIAKIALKIYQKSVANSTNVIYVSRYLENRYPTKGKLYTWSGVKINPVENEIIEKRFSRISSDKKEIVIGLIGYVNNNIKGVGTAIRAIRNLDKRYKLKILGGGNHDRYDSIIHEFNLADRVKFCGVLTGGEKVLSWLDDIDIYIQPSLTEGLPKATLEAMSRGCPVIASNVGGLPDIVNPKYLHKANDNNKLFELIKQLSSNTDEMIKLSRYSFNIAEQYSLELMRKRFASIISEVGRQAINKKKA